MFFFHYAYAINKFKLSSDIQNNILDGFRDTINGTREDVRKIANGRTTRPTGEIPDISSPRIPLNPREGNYSLKYWHQASWQVIKNRAGPDADMSDNEDSASSILTLFFETESGQPVASDAKDEVRKDLAAYWVDMLLSGERPTTYAGLGLKRREHYRITMEDKFPWLRLCDGHWKVRQIWINYFKPKRIQDLIIKYEIPMDVSGDTPESPIVISGSSDAGSPPGQKKTPPPPIDISSDTEGSSPTPGLRVSSGTKRQHEGGNYLGDGPSKKSKGKEKAVAGSDFHPARPKPRKKVNARVGMVSEHPPLLTKRLLKTTRLTHCTHSSLCSHGENTDLHPSPVQNST